MGLYHLSSFGLKYGAALSIPPVYPYAPRVVTSGNLYTPYTLAQMEGAFAHKTVTTSTLSWSLIEGRS